MSAGAPAWKVWTVWLSRVLSGAVFILSGWAKAVDPRGFALKIDEYLSVWGIYDFMPEGITGVAACGISVFELCVGVLLLTGSMRRGAPLCGLAMMLVWLPLTIYIMVADPVADCGCFGDFLILSNTATVIKNVILTVLLILCLKWYKAARPLYRPGLQWLIPSLTALYGLIIALIGWHIQPVVDFRPYPVGSTLTAGDDDASAGMYVYTKDGVEREFSLDELPDSTWTFVRMESRGDEGKRALAVFDGDDEVTDLLFGPDAPEQMIVLVYPHPGFDDLMRSRMANEIHAYAEENGIDMIGIVAASDETLEQWKELARPSYPVYSSDDTSLKQLVRGAVGIIYLRDGRVVWKRNFTSLPVDLLSEDDPLATVAVVDDGRVAAWLAGFYLAGMLILLAISKLTTFTLRLRKKSQKASGN